MPTLNPRRQGDHCRLSLDDARLLEPKEEVTPVDDNDGWGWDPDNHSGTVVGPIIVRGRPGIIRVKRMAVVVPVMSVVINVPPVMVVVVVGARRRGEGKAGNGQQCEQDFMDGFHFF